MKHIIIILGIVFLSFGLGFYVRCSDLSNYKMEGTVLYIEDDHALVSKKMNISQNELTKSSTEWLYEECDLIYVGPIHDVEPGTKVRLIIEGPVMSSYPARAKVESYEIIK